MFNEGKFQFGAGDIRFTQSKDGKTLYAFFLGWPKVGRVNIRSLSTNDAGQPALLDRQIQSLALLGTAETIQWTRDGEGLHVTLPPQPPCQEAFALKLQLE
jgi:alpha-L-fucosidase